MTNRYLRALPVLIAFLSSYSLPVSSQQASSPGTLTFQSGKQWSPRTNINADTVMVYGIDETTADRIRSWREHGYHVTVMTGVAWGRYAPYLRGDFDGKQHWSETQQEKSGKLILHSGREVPYISPSESYGRYLAQGVEKALDAGAEAIYLEEPEFWARAGWSDSFKQSWQDFYHESWQAPDSSPDAQYRASKLKYYLYRRALAQVFEAVKQYGIAHHRTIPCYVATHSLINYAQWQIVSPESSLLDVGADGYIAQVWTGTSRTPNVYDGVNQQRTFETAFLEYGALQNISRSSGKRIWYLNDPIEDNPRHSWTDYRTNWESTLVASLLQPEVSRYEVLPWPERIFGDGREYPTQEPSDANPNPPRSPIPESYATELQTVFHALGQMNLAAKTQWQIAGTQGIGVLVSDTLMFQRAQPQPSDENLGQFYGLALPPLMHGMPVEPVQIESTYATNGSEFLKRYKILLLSYDGQKPPSPKFHIAIAAWVRNGGALIVLDDDSDPYNKAKDWWNTEGRHDDTPRQDLFRELGLNPSATGAHSVGKGVVLFEQKSPVALTYDAHGSTFVMNLIQEAATAIHLPVEETRSLVLRRGPYVIAAGLDETTTASSKVNEPLNLRGNFIDLFQADLPVQHGVTVKPGTRALLLDIDKFQDSEPRVLAASGLVTEDRSSSHSLTFTLSGIDRTTASIRILTPLPVRSVQLNGSTLPQSAIQPSGKTTLIHVANTATPQHLSVEFK